MRTCMFCGGESLTREDAWPLWLVRKFPAQNGVIVEAERGASSLKPWRQKGHFTKVKFVCATCNNGWMSQIEDRAKPIIESLLTGDHLELPHESQLVLARWSVKCAMVFEALRADRDWFYEPNQRSQIANGTIPAGYTVVWIAGCANLHGIHCAASDMSEGPEWGTSETQGFMTTMAFGSIAIQVLTLRPSDSVPDGVNITTNLRPGPWSDLALQIWPPSESANWPRAVGLDGETGIDAFRMRFRPLGPLAQ